MTLDRLDPTFADADYSTPADARAYPAVDVSLTVDGSTVTRTVPVLVVPDMVSVGGGFVLAGVIIQPEHVACAFPTLTDAGASFIAECVAYARNEGAEESPEWETFPRDFGADDVDPAHDDAALRASFNAATRAACAVLDSSEA